MKNRAFTLVELLVVVLIVGILAAIAVPQYQKSVLKTKYTRAKANASEIAKAYELYYLRTGSYPTKFSELDFAHKFTNYGDIKIEEGYYCAFYDPSKEIYCNIIDKLSYFIKYSNYKPTRSCRAHSLDKSDIYNKFCKQETGATSSRKGSSYYEYMYTD